MARSRAPVVLGLVAAVAVVLGLAFTLGGAGEALLSDVRVGTLAVQTQDPAVVRLSGHAETFSGMDSGGTLDARNLTYDHYDRQVINSYFD